MHGLGSLSRRRFAAGIGGLAASLALPRQRPARAAAMPVPEALIARRFRAFWDQDPIGTHEFTVTPGTRPGDWQVAADIDMLVDLGMLGELVYRHTSRETWRDGRLAELESQTDDDGDRYGVTGRAVGDYFRMVGPGGPFEAPGELPTSNGAWSEAICQQSEIIDATTGAAVGLVASFDRTTMTSTSAGPELVRVYQVISPIVAGSLWYDQAGIWVKSQLERSGEEIEYVFAP